MTYAEFHRGYVAGISAASQRVHDDGVDAALEGDWERARICADLVDELARIRPPDEP